jgi:CubicO group peptidase (beta-lactamase class C family)
MRLVERGKVDLDKPVDEHLGVAKLRDLTETRLGSLYDASRRFEMNS